MNGPAKSLIGRATELLHAVGQVNHILNRMNEMLASSSLSQAAILDTIIEEVRQLMPADTIGQFLLIRGGQFEIVASTDPEDVGVKLALANGVCGWVVANRQAAVVPDIAKPDSHPAARHYLAVFPKQRAEITVPLYAGSRILGVVNYENTRPDAFDETHLEILEFLATGAAAAVIVSERQRQLLHMSGALADSIGSPGGVYGALVRTVCDLTDAAFGQILTYDVATDHLTIVASTHPDDLARPDVPPEKSVSGAAAHSGKPVNVPDISVLRREGRYDDRLGNLQGSELAVPVLQGGSVTHILNVESPEPGAFSAEDEEILCELTNFVKVVGRMEKLFRVGFHSMAGPIATLKRQLGRIRPAAESRRDPVEVIRRNVEYLESAIGMMKPRPLNIETQPLRPAVESALALFDDFAAPITIAVDWPGLDRLPPVSADRVLLIEVIKNLIENAIDELAETPRDDRRLSLALDTSRPGFAGLAFQDNGRGISEDEQARLFKMFYTTKTAGKGSGLGLSFVRDVLIRMGGDIVLDSRPGRGSVFTLFLKTGV